VQGIGSRPELARGVYNGSTKNGWVAWLSHKTKTAGSACRDGSVRVEKLRSWQTRVGITWLASGGRGLQQRRGRAMKRSAT
jgi:hypothetical protein